MKRVFLFALAFVLMAGFCSASGRMMFLDKKVKRVQRIPFRIYWIETEDGSSYLASSNGRFVIENPVLLDMQTKKRLETLSDLMTAMKPDAERVAVLYLAKTGKPEALIVVDEYCPYCEQLVKDILKLLQSGKKPKYDLAVTFFPIHRQAVDASCKLLHAGKKKARQMYLKWVSSKDPSVWNEEKCTPEARKKFLTLAAQLRTMNGISATPTIILPDGTQLVGYRNPEFLFEGDKNAK